MARSVLEGVIFNIYMVALSLVEVVGDLNMIQATGGFTSSELWTQILADIFEQPINVPESREAGCLAAIIMAEKALGLIEDISEIETMVGTNETYQPNPKISKFTEKLVQYLSDFLALSWQNMKILPISKENLKKKNKLVFFKDSILPYITKSIELIFKSKL